ncbi:hypothetical protein VNI00_004059 [Paramarasmius palmivorus]|uniref:Xylanolytic transcriptional activator regulatory domain-containing protein n=1 Tax=Paramarasmius palmivorus TaxID=297713 RepID=A0AAW0DRW7_9AGAR
MIVSDTTALHKKIEEMGQRIRQLEDALAIFQASVSTERHPLLRDELLKIKFPPETSSDSPDGIVKTENAHLELADALGTLTLGESGDARYLGRSAGPESLLTSDMQYPNAIDDPSAYSFVSKEIAQLSNSFPFRSGAAWDIDQCMERLISYLPQKLRAWSLCETYLGQECWTSKIISREELIDDILGPVYRYVDQQDEDQDLPVSPHRLAVLFFVFALGALVDLTIPPHSVEAENYFELARACLSLRSVFGLPEIGTVQGLALAAMYHNHGGPRYSGETAWCLICLSAKLCQSMGLHSDSPKWHLDEKTLQRRRTLFWEVFTLDAFISMNVGRQPSISLSYVDCQFPDEEEINDPELKQRDICLRWGWKFAKEVVSHVAASALLPHVPEYDTILDLDKRVRQHWVPPSMDLTREPGENGTISPPYKYTRGIMLASSSGFVLLECASSTLTLHFRSAMMHIHRSWFVQAILDYPLNPLCSPYAPSFLAAYRTASITVQLCVRYFTRYSELLSRWWAISNGLFSAGVIIGSIVTRCPTSTMAPKAFEELGLAVKIFELLSAQSCRTLAAYTILKRLHDKATRIFSQSHGTSQGDASTPSVDDTVDSGDELQTFAGFTKVRISKSMSSKKRRSKGNGPEKSGRTGSWAESDQYSSSSGSTVGVTGYGRPTGSSPSPQDEISAAYGQDPFAQSIFATTIPGSGDIPFSDYNINNTEYEVMDWTMPETSSMSMAGESGMDAQWLSFMQNEGILDGNGNLNTNTFT